MDTAHANDTDCEQRARCELEGWRARLKETLDHAPVPPEGSETVAEDELPETVAEDELHIDLGYWTEARSADQASVAVDEVVAQTIQLAEEDVVLASGYASASRTATG